MLTLYLYSLCYFLHIDESLYKCQSVCDDLDDQNTELFLWLISCAVPCQFLLSLVLLWCHNATFLGSIKSDVIVFTVEHHDNRNLSQISTELWGKIIMMTKIKCTDEMNHWNQETKGETKQNNKNITNSVCICFCKTLYKSLVGGVQYFSITRCAFSVCKWCLITPAHLNHERWSVRLKNLHCNWSLSLWDRM